MNRIRKTFKDKSNILSIYVTSCFPKKDSAVPLITTLAESGVDMIELGVPFSDPLADGPTIQKVNSIALKNGSSLKLALEEAKEARSKISIPIVMMGHLNPILQFGVEKFLKLANEAGVDGIILPDLPVEVYEKKYQALFEEYNIAMVFLVTSETPLERIKLIDSVSRGFIYVVSQPSITGGQITIDDSRKDYFKRISDLKLNNPLVVGFGIDSKEKFDAVCEYADGGIIASAYLRELENSDDIIETTKSFVKKIRG